MSYISWQSPKNTPTGSYSPPPQDVPVATTNALGEEGGGYYSPRPSRPKPGVPMPSQPPTEGTSGYYGENGYYPYPTPPKPTPRPQPYPQPVPKPSGQSFSTIDVLKVIQEADGGQSPNGPLASQPSNSNQSALTIYRPTKDGVVTQNELKSYLDGLNKIQNIQFDPELQQKKDIAQTLLNNYTFVANRDGLPSMSFMDIVQTASRDGNVYDFNTRTDLLQLKPAPFDFPIWTSSAQS